MASISSQTQPSTSSSPSPSVSNGGGSGFGSSSPSGFYRNLFYILIGLLCAFVIVSILTLCRTRRRRRLIVQEAARLGVLVPGVPGYISARDRARGLFPTAQGWTQPTWWETQDSKFTSPAQNFTPISITPTLQTVQEVPPIPVSTLPYFPQTLAYRAEMYAPPPSVPTDLDELVGHAVDVGVLVRMPRPERPVRAAPAPEAVAGEEDDEGVMREWEGVELGVLTVDVARGDGWR